MSEATVSRRHRVAVGTIEEIPPGERKIVVPFRGRAGIGIFNIGGRLHALRNICPNKQGPLCTGFVSGRVVGDLPPSSGIDNLVYEREGEIIRCPWHLWEFEIATGRCLVDPTVRVKTYPVVIEDDQIFVEYDD